MIRAWILALLILTASTAAGAECIRERVCPPGQGCRSVRICNLDQRRTVPAQPGWGRRDRIRAPSRPDGQTERCRRVRARDDSGARYWNRACY